jgi:hypothetical protein
MLLYTRDSQVRDEAGRELSFRVPAVPRGNRIRPDMVLEVSAYTQCNAYDSVIAVIDEIAVALWKFATITNLCHAHTLLATCALRIHNSALLVRSLYLLRIQCMLSDSSSVYASI